MVIYSKALSACEREGDRLLFQESQIHLPEHGVGELCGLKTMQHQLLIWPILVQVFSSLVIFFATLAVLKTGAYHSDIPQYIKSSDRNDCYVVFNLLSVVLFRS